MKNIKNIMKLLILIVVITNNYVYGSFADYTDEQAAKDTEKLIEEYNNNYDYTKSNNNYLKTLNVEQGELSPVFDKQKVEYDLTLKKSIEEINIIANAEDDKAIIDGAGIINIKEQTKCKIDVIAESGTVRTYFINIIRTDENGETALTNASLNEKENTILDIVNNDKESERFLNKQKHNNKHIFEIAIIAISVLVIFIFIFCIKHRGK